MECVLGRSNRDIRASTSVSRIGVGRLRVLVGFRRTATGAWTGEVRRYAGTNATAVHLDARSNPGDTIEGNHQWIANTTFTRNTRLTHP